MWLVLRRGEHAAGLVELLLMAASVEKPIEAVVLSVEPSGPESMLNITPVAAQALAKV